MSWKKERDALIAQTMAFVQSVAGKREEAPALSGAFASVPIAELPALPELELSLRLLFLLEIQRFVLNFMFSDNTLGTTIAWLQTVLTPVGGLIVLFYDKLVPLLDRSKVAGSKSAILGNTQRFCPASSGQECSSGSMRMRRAAVDRRTGRFRVPWRESSSTQMVSRFTCRGRLRADGTTATMSPNAWSTGLPVTMGKDGVWRRRRLSGR